METKLPLVVVQGSFKVLERLDCPELEVFLRYVISFIKKRRIRKSPSSVVDEDFKNRPLWWTQKVPYPTEFTQGAPIPYVPEKEMKLRKIVKSVYNFYHCKDLLDLSDRLAMTHAFSYFYKYNPNKSITVYQSESNSPLVTIPPDNLTYDLQEFRKPEVTIHCKELNTSLSEFRARPIVKKSPMKLIDSAKSSVLKRLPAITPVFVVSDSDDEEVVNKENDGKGITIDSETIVIDDSSDDDCTIVSISDILTRPLRLGRLPPKATVKKKLEKIEQHEKSAIIRKKGKRQIKRPKYYHDEDSCSSEDSGTIIINDDIVEVTDRPSRDTIDKISFLKYFQLNTMDTKSTETAHTYVKTKSTCGRSKDPSIRVSSDTRSRRRVASRLPYQLFELESVERLVAANHLPPGCLIDPEEEQKRTEMRIGRYLRDIQPGSISRTNSQGSAYVTSPCVVLIERLPPRVLYKYLNRKDTFQAK